MNPYKQWDKTCTAGVAPFSVGEYTSWRKKNRRCASLIGTSHRTFAVPQSIATIFLFINKWSYFAFSFWSQIFPFSIFIPRGMLLQSPMPCVDLAAFALMLVSGCGRWETAEIRTMEERRVLVWLCLCLLQCGRNTAGVSICSLVLECSHLESWVRPHVLLVVKIERSLREGRRLKQFTQCPIN